MNSPSQSFIDHICKLYGDVYDDRIEDSRPPAAGEARRDAGEDWVPGQIAAHKSLSYFQEELAEQGIRLSTSKIKKILITGGCWTTERSRQIADLYDLYTRSEENGGLSLSGDEAVRRIAGELEVSAVTVSVNLPYQDVVYNLEGRSKNAERCSRYRKRQAEKKAGL